MPTILSVRELTHYIREVLEFDDLLSDVWVEGEVSNLTRSSAGHVYFTLKESEAQLSCVFFRGMVSRVARLPQNGDAVLVQGRVSFYEAGGRLQLYVNMLRPLGLGELFLRFQELKERLEREGLFDAALKRDLPPFPLRIGVVTSPTAAALQDILHVLQRRYPLAEVVVSPTLVQGKDAAPQIVAALDRLYKQQVDLVIVSRGGGSLEDLWPFNEEIVARAIRAAPVPVVSGVGHETDFTIADFAADLRAPTPSAAAEVSVPDQDQLRQQLLRLGDDLQRIVQQQLLEARRRLEERTQHLQRLSPAIQIADRRQRVDEMAGRISRSLQHRLAVTQERLRSALLRLEALGPASTLQRGYAIVCRQQDGAVVVSPDEVASGDALDIQVQHGTFEAEVTE